MGLFASILGKRALDVNDERLWTTWAGPPSVSGVAVNATTAMCYSAVWACVRLISESMATMPLIMYRRLPDGGRERATEHPLYDLFKSQPNAQQTAYEFVEMMTGHVLLRGDAYAQIVPGQRGLVDQLVPLHPDRVDPERLENGAVRYGYRKADGTRDYLNDDDVFHLRGLSDDGLTGMSVIQYGRESIGLGIAAEQYGARFFGNNSRPGGLLKYPGKQLSTEALKRLQGSWEAAHARENAHRVAVLEDGLEWVKVGVDPDDAQFLQTREFQIEDVARWFRVPLHMIQMTSKSTSWGSGIEQQSLGFQMFTLLSWARRWEQAIDKDLILAPQLYFAEFLLDALVRADQKTRYDAYATGRQWGWLSANDVRRLENMNPIDGGDRYMVPLNMMQLNPDTGMAEPMPEPMPPIEPGNGPGSAHYRLLLVEAAGRIIRKEQAALQRAAGRCNGDGQAWETAVSDFFADHGRFVAEVLGIPPEKGELYATQKRKTALELGSVGIAALWDDYSVTRLAQMGEEYGENGV